MRKRKKPSHWPYVTPTQQIEGLAFVTKQFSINAFERSLNVLVYNEMMSKSRRSVMLRRYRKIAGISYEDWRKSK